MRWLNAGGTASAISFSQGPEWSPLISKYIGTIPPSHGGSCAAAQIIAIFPPLPTRLQMHTVYGYAVFEQEEGGRMRVSRRKKGLSCVCSAALALGLWGLARTQVQTGASAGPPRIPGQNENGIQVYLRAGLKTHGPGLHDYPQFIADWSKFLTEHGAVVTGSLHAPLAQELNGVAVLVIYKGDSGYLTDADRAALETFIKRGGGIVSIHDALCGPDPAYFATLVGGAKKHGEVNYTLEANVPYTVVDSTSPLVKGIAGLTLRDEAFFSMTWAVNPKIHVLVTTVIDATPSAGTHKGEVVPQIWTYEHSLPGGQPARAFVWMQGHKYANFAEPQIQNMLLRAIAWAGKHPVDELVDYKPPPAPQRQ